MDNQFTIDENRLDKEWIRQPLAVYEYAMKLAEARRAHDEAKTKLDLTKAELDTQIRQAPEAFGVAKITESAVAAAIASHTLYTTAVEAVTKARYEVDVHSAALNALDHKKHALQDLVKLYGQNYYGQPIATPEDTGVVKKEMNQGFKQQVSKRLQESRTK